ncbi:MAG: amino acid permease [Chrysiogenetes bacterium]|nr:amino acid permease [Chrysiogenetes bacterium]
MGGSDILFPRATLPLVQPGESSQPSLRRALGLPLLTLYGLGTILGAGIYVLVGEIAAKAGVLAPLSFVLAALMAAFTALSYAELSSRFPRSAGEAAYMHEAFARPALSRAVGIAMAGVGIASSATIAEGFAGYLTVFAEIPEWVSVTLLCCALVALAIWGISESARAASAITLLEIGGLLFVVAMAGSALGELPARLEAPGALHWGGVGAGALFAFYAFLGFEDMVVVSEEVRDPSRNLPRAIIIALVVSTLLYLIVALVCVAAVEPARLGTSKAPLSLVLEGHGGARVIALVSLFAVSNGALIQMIKSSRILYGLSREGWIGPALGVVGARTRTPVRATLLVGALVWGLSLLFDLGALASATSYLTLGVFALVNAALIRVKSSGAAPAGVRVFPLWVPWCGFGVIFIFLAYSAFWR